LSLTVDAEDLELVVVEVDEPAGSAEEERVVFFVLERVEFMPVVESIDSPRKIGK